MHPIGVIQRLQLGNSASLYRVRMSRAALETGSFREVWCLARNREDIETTERPEPDANGDRGL